MSTRSRREKRRRVSEKISVLRREGEPEKKAVATALSMERAHRLRRGGVYLHKRGGRRRARRRG